MEQKRKQKCTRTLFAHIKQLRKPEGDREADIDYRVVFGFRQKQKVQEEKEEYIRVMSVRYKNPQ